MPIQQEQNQDLAIQADTIKVLLASSPTVTMKEISKEIGLPLWVVRKVCNLYGIRTNFSKKYRVSMSDTIRIENEKPAILSRCKTNERCSNIAKAYNIPVGRLYLLIKKNHIQRPLSPYSRTSTFSVFKNRLRRAELGAKRRQIEFAITEKDIEAAFVSQNGRCPLSGVEIDFAGRRGTASLDRIDSSRGYVPDNIQWVHKTVNLMKGQLPQDLFISLCREIVYWKTKK
jgi:hypothetical protein